MLVKVMFIQPHTIFWIIAVSIYYTNAKTESTTPKKLTAFVGVQDEQVLCKGIYCAGAIFITRQVPVRDKSMKFNQRAYMCFVDKGIGQDNARRLIIEIIKDVSLYT